MIEIFMLLGVLFCAVQAIRSNALLQAALWLATTSALTAATLYVLGGQQAAVMELSVGAGLVSVLLVYAISLVGHEEALPSTVSKWLAAGLIGSLLLLLIGFGGLQGQPTPSDTSTASFIKAFWEDRQLDALLQIVIICTGGMSIIGFLVPQANKLTRISKQVAEQLRDPEPPCEAQVEPAQVRIPEEVSI